METVKTAVRKTENTVLIILAFVGMYCVGYLSLIELTR